MTNRRATHRAASIALVALALVGAAGCSDDDEPTSGSITTTAADPSSPSTSEAPDVTGPGATDADGQPVTGGTEVPTSNPGDSGAPGTTQPSFGELLPIQAGAPVRVLSCETDDDGHLVATVELDNITDLPIEAQIEVLFEDADAVEIERALGTIDVIMPGESGTGTVTSEADSDMDDAGCLLIGMQRREVLPRDLPED